MPKVSDSKNTNYLLPLLKRTIFSLFLQRVEPSVHNQLTFITVTIASLLLELNFDP